MNTRSFALPAASRLPALEGFVQAATRFAPGLAAAGLVAASALGLGDLAWFQRHGIGALTLAIVLGIVVGNLGGARFAAAADMGTGFAKQRLLRLGIVLYGLRLSIADIGHVGLAGLAIDALVLTSTFGLASWLGPRLFGLDRTTAQLIGAGSAICGAAAVLATAPVLRAKAAQTTVAVATVVVFGTLAIFVYPALWQSSFVHARVSPHAYGLWTGSTIHEVAQVVAAGRAGGDDAGDTAVIAKLVRVMMLAPFLVALSAWFARRGGAERAGERAPITVPWFAFGFLAMCGLDSLVALPHVFVAAANAFDGAVLAVAMAALGLTTRVASLREAGLRPLALAAALFGWLILGGGAINLVMSHLLG